jgi:hypothetical protein
MDANFAKFMGHFLNLFQTTREKMSDENEKKMKLRVKNRKQFNSIYLQFENLSMTLKFI